MANWKQVTLTNAGRELAAAVTAGQLKLNITEIWFGSGTPANLETATDLAAQKNQGRYCQHQAAGHGMPHYVPRQQ